MSDFSDLDSPDPLRRDLAYLRLLEELLGPEWVEQVGSGAREAGCAAGLAVGLLDEAKVVDELAGGIAAAPSNGRDDSGMDVPLPGRPLIHRLDKHAEERRDLEVRP